eukprot:m.32914 g.32914  ORF g.32914 m.32914 type:complete len:631 (+) comp5049_c0_seq2:5-1897(+)
MVESVGTMSVVPSVNFSMEEDDPVVAEVDVYLAQSLKDSLYLFQFPLRPFNKPYFLPGEEVSARVKANQKLIELKGQLDADSEFYDPNAGEVLAQNANFKAEGIEAQPLFAPKGHLDSYTLQSSTAPLCTHYAVGALCDGELHLTTIHGAVQFRPALVHLDEADSRRRAPERREEKMKEEEDDDEPTAVTVTFKRKETEKTIAARKKSHSYMQKQLDEESWCSIKYVHSADDAARQHKSRLYTAKTSAVIPMKTPRPAYLRALTAMPGTALAPPPTAVRGAMNRKDIAALSVADRVLTVMRQSELLSYSTLLEQLGLLSDAEEHTAQQVLQQNCLHLGGAWVIRSEVLYPEGKNSWKTNAPRRVMLKARNIILALFQQGRTVRRSDIWAVTKLNPEEIREILKPIAVRTANEGWNLRPSTDTQSPRDLEKGSDAAWRDLLEETAEAVNAIINKPSPTDLPAVTPHVPPRPRQTARMRAEEAPRAMPATEMAQGSAETLALALRRLLLTHGAVSPEKARQTFLAQHGDLISDSDFEAIVTGAGGRFLSSSGALTIIVLRERGDSEDQHRAVLYGLFERSETLKKGDVVKAFEAAGLAALSNPVYMRLLKEIAVSKSSVWQLKPGKCDEGDA